MKVGVDQERGDFVAVDEVFRFHTEGLNRALQQHDFATLEAIYSERYMLVRPDGTVLNKNLTLSFAQLHQGAVAHNRGEPSRDLTAP